MAKCSLLLLGPPQLVNGDRAGHLHLRKCVALIAYLAVEGREFSREHLATLLWPELGQAQALANLRRTLSQLRDAIGTACIVTEGDTVRIDPDHVATDLDRFMCAPSDGDTSPASLASTIDIYRGDFLEGFSLGNCRTFDDWQDAVRRRCASHLDLLLEQISSRYLQLNAPERALLYATRWVELDQLNEAAHRMLMEIHSQSGRLDLERRQFADCSSALAEEGLEPDDVTVELHDMITRNHGSPTGNGRPSAGQPPDGEGKRRRSVRTRVYWIAGACLFVCLAMAASRFFVLAFPPSFGVEDVNTVLAGESVREVSIVIRNDSVRRDRAEYWVSFVQDGSIGTYDEFMVYRGATQIGRRSMATVELNSDLDILPYVQGHGVQIPAGMYTLSVTVNPEGASDDWNGSGNRAADTASFFFPGAIGTPVLDVAITAGPEALTHGDTEFRIVIGNPADYRDPDLWVEYRIARPGRYLFPPPPTVANAHNGFGCFLVVIQGMNDYISPPYFFSPEVTAGLFQEGPGNLVYGDFSASLGTTMYPGNHYSVEFSPPPDPVEDEFEEDDSLERGTLIDPSHLPVHQYHTFHSDGSGDLDRDWFRMRVQAGTSVAVETHSAGGLLETDTALDFNIDSGHVKTNWDKSPESRYSRIVYTNDTGIDQECYFVARPYNQHRPMVHGTGEYIISISRP